MVVRRLIEGPTQCTHAGALTVCRDENLLDSRFVVHGFSTRWRQVEGGRVPFDLRRGRADAAHNRRLLCGEMGLEHRFLVAAEQVHGGAVAVVGAGAASESWQGVEAVAAGVDGLITSNAGVALMMFFADCVPVLLWDPESNAVGLVHAGWRGTASRVARSAVEAMRSEYGNRSEGLRALIGPAICGECYEVAEPVAAALRGAVPGQHLFLNRVKSGWQADLKEANRQELLAAGLSPASISVSQYCTRCHADIFFSHRGDGEDTGRHGAVIALRGRHE